MSHSDEGRKQERRYPDPELDDDNQEDVPFSGRPRVQRTPAFQSLDQLGVDGDEQYPPVQPTMPPLVRVIEGEFDPGEVDGAAGGAERGPVRGQT